MPRRRARFLVGPALLGALLLGAVSVPTSAAADEGSTTAPDVPPYLIPTELPAGAVVGDPAGEFQSEPTVPLEVSEALVRLEFEHPELSISGTAWDPDTGVVSLYAAANRKDVDQALDAYGLTGLVEYERAKHGYADMQEKIHRIIGKNGALASGHKVVMATPSLDGGRIALVLDETTRGKGTPALPDVGVTVSVDYGPALQPATRNHAPNPPTNPWRYSGAFMQNGPVKCTTGFRGTKISDSSAAMLSANHCESTIGKQWYYSSLTDYTIGQYQGTNPPPTMNGLPDVAVWSGSGTAQMDAGIFIGNNTVSGSYVYAIRGVAGTTVGASVCYSGSRSGTVCGSSVTAVNVTACYSGMSFCYDRLARTLQGGGLPAAGQGDSGGPVYSTNSGVYATGIISGLINGTTTCTGDAGGRLCSADLLYAPITDAFDLGYGINYYPN